MKSLLHYREVTELSENDQNQLAKLLVDTVEDGASLGFLPPMKPEDAQTYWSSVLDEQVKMWVVTIEDVIVGTIQLHLVSRPNGLHRAEIAKLMVHPSAQRKGIGRGLMLLAEARAQAENRSLLVLDTREGDVSNQLYQSMGYQEAGRIPQFARSADGSLHGTVLYFKTIE